MNNPKIAEALAVMCRNPNKISEVRRETDDFYSFKYLGNQVWSVSKPFEDEIWVRFYPKATKFDGVGEYVEYKKSEVASSDVLSATSMRRVFDELFSTVRDLNYHMNDVIDAIVKSDRAAV